MTDAPLFSYDVAHTILTDSPRHALAPREPATEGMDIGSAVHAVVLGKGRDIVVIEAPDWRTKAAKDARDAARLAGQTPILAHKWAAVQAMVEAVLLQLGEFESPVPFTNGVAEESIFWEEDGVSCRATPDWLRNDFQTCDDLKTTAGSANPAIFSRTLWDKGYDLQAALYRRAVKRLVRAEPEFRFVVAETAPPYALSVVSLDPQALEFANVKLDRALAIWRRCLETGVFPAYPTRTCYAEVPPYLVSQFEMRSYYESEATP